MKILKIKKQDRVTRNKTVRARRTKVADAESANYLFYDEELPMQFHINSLFNFFSKSNRTGLKRNIIKITRS